MKAVANMIGVEALGWYLWPQGQELEILEYVEVVPIKWKGKRRFAKYRGKCGVDN
jgi:hypothetical protein